MYTTGAVAEPSCWSSRPVRSSITLFRTRMPMRLPPFVIWRRRPFADHALTPLARPDCPQPRTRSPVLTQTRPLTVMLPTSKA